MSRLSSHLFTSLHEMSPSDLRGELDAGNGHGIPSIHDITMPRSQRIPNRTADNSPHPQDTGDCSRPGCSDSARLNRGSLWRDRDLGTRWSSTARSRDCADSAWKMRGKKTSSGRRFDQSSRSRDSWSSFSRSYLGVNGNQQRLFSDQVIHHLQSNVRADELVEAI